MGKPFKYGSGAYVYCGGPDSGDENRKGVDVYADGRRIRFEDFLVEKIGLVLEAFFRRMAGAA